MRILRENLMDFGAVPGKLDTEFATTDDSVTCD